MGVIKSVICLENYRRKNPFFLAPMAGVTDKPFRSFMKEMGCGIITSELISARALQDESPKTMRLMEFSEDQRPYGIQIFGEEPYLIGEGAKRAESFGADFIDLNLGCPVNKIVKKGAGSALLKDLKKLSKVLSSLKSSVRIPVSLKIRIGWDELNRNADQVASMAYEEGFSWVSIHGRTRSQGYSGKADWNYIREVKSKSSIPIVGNGDLNSGKRAFEALQFSGCDAVMIGRGCLNDPWIFLEALDSLKQSQKGKPEEIDLNSKSERGKDSARACASKEEADLSARACANKREADLSMEAHASKREADLSMEACANKREADLNLELDRGGHRHSSLFLRTEDFRRRQALQKDFKMAVDKLKCHLESFYDERMFLLQLKKFSAWFSAGFPDSTDFRKNLFQEKNSRILLQKIDDFFSKTQDFEKPAPVYEPFLMRGHG